MVDSKVQASALFIAFLSLSGLIAATDGHAQEQVRQLLFPENRDCKDVPTNIIFSGEKIIDAISGESCNRPPKMRIDCDALTIENGIPRGSGCREAVRH